MRRDLTGVLIGGVAALAILAPAAWAYWVVHREFGYERGLTDNLVALAPEGGARTAAGFDTFGDARASAQLAAWVRALPPGTIVIGAVSDEASAQLGTDAVAAFRTVGVETDMRGRFRESHAFVGVKGAAPGAALEEAGPRVVELRVGSPEFPAGFALVEFALIDPPRR